MCGVNGPDGPKTLVDSSTPAPVEPTPSNDPLARKLSGLQPSNQKPSSKLNVGASHLSSPPPQVVGDIKPNENPPSPKVLRESTPKPEAPKQHPSNPRRDLDKRRNSELQQKLRQTGLDHGIERDAPLRMDPPLPIHRKLTDLTDEPNIGPNFDPPHGTPPPRLTRKKTDLFEQPGLAAKRMEERPPTNKNKPQVPPKLRSRSKSLGDDRMMGSPGKVWLQNNSGDKSLNKPSLSGGNRPGRISNSELLDAPDANRPGSAGSNASSGSNESRNQSQISLNNDVPLGNQTVVLQTLQQSSLNPARLASGSQSPSSTSNVNQSSNLAGDISAPPPQQAPPGPPPHPYHDDFLSGTTPGLPSKSNTDKAKHVGAYVGYGIQSVEKSLKSGSGFKTQHISGHWEPWKKPELNKGQITPPVLKDLKTTVSIAGDLAQPFKLLEYGAASKKAIEELISLKAAKKIIAEYNRLWTELQHENPNSNDSTVQRKFKRLDELTAKKVLAQKTLDKGKWELFTSQTKAYVGFGKYAWGTEVAFKHAVAAGKSGFSRSAYDASVSAGKTTAATVGKAVVGSILDPVSAVYYGIQAKKDSEKLVKLDRMNRNARTAVVQHGADKTLKSVAQRVQNKTEKNRLGTKFKRWTNRLRSAVSGIGAVGSTFGLLAAFKVGGAFVAGVAVTAAAWPAIVAIAGTAALLTASYGIYQLARHIDSHSDKKTITDAYTEVQQRLTDQGAVYQHGLLEASDKLYESKSLGKALKLLEQDGDYVTGLRARFENGQLTRGDLDQIRELLMHGHIRRDSNAAAFLLVERLLDEGPPSQNRPPQNNNDSAANLLRTLGVSDAKVDAIYKSARQAKENIAGLDTTASDHQKQLKTAQKPLRDAMKLLMKEMQLR